MLAYYYTIIIIVREMYVIVKHIVNHLGVNLPVIILGSENEILEFETQDEAEKIKDIFQTNSDSDYKYEVKKI